jgi:hypothetical protein
MDKKPEKRPRNDPGRAQRLFVKRLAGNFLSAFNEPLTTVIQHLVAALGCERDDRNIERIVKEARKEHKQVKPIKIGLVMSLLASRTHADRQ